MSSSLHKSDNPNHLNPNNTEKYLQDNKHLKKELASLSNGYSNHLQKSLERLTTSSEVSVDKELVTKITQIHKDKLKIEKQHEKLKSLHHSLQKLSQHLESDLSDSKKYLMKKKMISISYNAQDNDPIVINNVQKKSELIDQQIRILENTIKLLETPNTSV